MSLFHFGCTVPLSTVAAQCFSELTQLCGKGIWQGRALWISLAAALPAHMLLYDLPRMMLWRRLLLWLVMAIIPLQGMAASSMLLCAMNSHHGHGAQTLSEQDRDQLGTARHDHAKHSHEKASPGSVSGTSTPAASHDCGACGACCHSTAIAEIPRWADPQPLEQTVDAEPFVFVHSLPVRVPDKPPRV